MAIDTIRLFGADAAEDGEITLHVGLSGAETLITDEKIPGLGETVKFEVTGTVTAVQRKRTEEAGSPYRISVAANSVKVKG